MKRAELSLNVIVIATLCLLVLVVVSYIFLKGTGSINSDLRRCESRGGTCLDQCISADGYIPLVSGSCQDSTTTNAVGSGLSGNADATQKCCIKRDELFGE